MGAVGEPATRRAADTPNAAATATPARDLDGAAAVAASASSGVAVTPAATILGAAAASATGSGALSAAHTTIDERLQEAASTGQLVPVTSPAVGPAAATPSEGRLDSAAIVPAASGAAIAPAASGATIAPTASGAAIAPAASGAAIAPTASGAAIAPSAFSPIAAGSGVAVATPAASCSVQNSLSCGSLCTAAAMLADGNTLAMPADGTGAATPAASSRSKPSGVAAAKVLSEKVDELSLETKPAPVVEKAPVVAGAPSAARESAPSAAVLSAEQLAALLSDESLLREVASAAGVPIENCSVPADLLLGCVVRRKTPFQQPGVPLYSPARLHAVYKEPRQNGMGDCWQLKLVALPAEGEEPPTCLAYVSNQPTDGEYAAAPTEGAAARLTSVLREDGRLRARVQEAALDAHSAAERRWFELLRDADLDEHEAEADQKGWYCIGEPSMHARLYCVLEACVAALVRALKGVPQASYDAWLQSFQHTVESWPTARKRVAIEWFRWLYSAEQRAAEYTLAVAFIREEKALSLLEHKGRDDAGLWSFPRAALHFHAELAKKLAKLKVAAPLDDPEANACERPTAAPPMPRAVRCLSSHMPTCDERRATAGPICLVSAPHGFRGGRHWCWIMPCRHWVCWDCWSQSSNRFAPAPVSIDDAHGDESGDGEGGEESGDETEGSDDDDAESSGEAQGEEEAAVLVAVQQQQQQGKCPLCKQIYAHARFMPGRASEQRGSSSASSALAAGA